MKLYNTLTRSLQPFEPLHPPAVTIYVCGPTVYDVPHIGHARSAYVFDVLRRYLAHQHFNVTFVRNVTDVDDKIIQKAREALGTADRGSQTADSLKKQCREVAERSLKSYHDALARLDIQPPDQEPKATEHVLPDGRHIDASMTGFIAQLLVNGSAYEAGGDVYFAVRKFPGYGKLSNRSIDELQSGARVEPGEHKQDPLDFALWKTAKADEPSWNSPWGKGRPGWHIECSVMSTRYLGDAFDIHGGGVDLVFPHHENEIAQAQALGKSFAKYWVHNGLLTVNGEKMSKSLGNYVTVDQALEEIGNTEVLKLLFLGTHYRNPLDYSVEAVRAAKARYKGLRDFLDRAKLIERPTQTRITHPEAEKLREKFAHAMGEDMNTPEALAALDELSTIGHASLEAYWRKVKPTTTSLAPHATPIQPSDSGAVAIAAAAVIRDLGDVVGLFQQMAGIVVPAEIQGLVDEREKARARKDFAAADQLRKKIDALGYLVEDAPGGSVVLPKRA